MGGLRCPYRSQVETATSTLTALAKHEAENAELIELRQVPFVSRRAILERLEHFGLGTTGSSAALLTAPSGAGKTSVMAALAARLSAAPGNSPLLLAYFFGNSTESGSVDAILRVFCDQMAEACEEPKLEEVAGHQRLREGFAHLLSRAAARRRVVLLLDALDRIEPTREARGMSWLPLRWPPNAKVIASAVDGSVARAFAVRTSAVPMSLAVLETDEARSLVWHLCALEHRKPNNKVVEAVLGARGAGGRPASTNLLWLTLTVGQLNRLQGAEFLLAGARFERLADAQLIGYFADWATRLPGDPQDLFAKILHAAEGHFDTDARHLADAIALARRGWRESDLLGILSERDGRPWQPIMLLRLRHALHGALAAGPRGCGASPTIA